MPLVVTHEGMGKESVKILGGKAANLSEMLNVGFPVPESFFITTEAYNKFAEHNKLRPKIQKIIKEIKFSDIKSLTQGTKSIRELILSGEIPASLEKEITMSYKKLAVGKIAEFAGQAYNFISAGKDLPFVAVRSSGISEDAEGASSAGQYETYLNIKGDVQLMEAIKKCWASLYTARVTYYRNKNKQPQDTTICVIIQKMVNSERSGVAFTINPTDPEEGSNDIVIEACWGLGETIVQGQVEPDHYIVDKTTGEIVRKVLGKKLIMRKRDIYTGETKIKDVPLDMQNAQVLDDNEIIALAAYCKKIENHYNKPQDIEWAIEERRIYITQTRAVTTLKSKKTEAVQGTPTLIGMGASPGVSTGPVKIIHDMNDLHKLQKGDILVTKMTTPDMVPAMEKAGAIITDQGGVTSHAAIVSREMQTPCIVGTKVATTRLKEGDIVTVDASHGNIFMGKLDIKEEKKEHVKIQTKVKIKVNVAFPDKITPELVERTDGIGLMRLEHLLTKGGMHPIEYLRQGKQDELINLLVDGIGKAAKAFYPKPVWIRSLDARTDEFRNMAGGDKEPTEPNPMLGWHGIRRTLEQTDILKSELLAVKILRDQGLDNVMIMLPFVINVDEFTRSKKIMMDVGVDAKMGIMIETPASALIIEDFIKAGIDFVSFGTNDLTQLALGIDRNNENIAKLYTVFHPSVLKMMKYCIEVCNKHNIETSICGEAGSNPKMVEILVGYGIKSISCNLDAIDSIKLAVSKVEK